MELQGDQIKNSKKWIQNGAEFKFFVMVSHGIDFGGMSHLKAGVVIV